MSRSSSPRHDVLPEIRDRESDGSEEAQRFGATATPRPIFDPRVHQFNEVEELLGCESGCMVQTQRSSLREKRLW